MRPTDRVIFAVIAAAGLAGFGAIELMAQPTRPPPTREQVAQMAAKRQAFCDGVLKLGVLAKTDFRAIDKGLNPGSDWIHGAALSLPDATECYISVVKGDHSYTCSFPSKPEVMLANTKAIGGLLGRCLGAPPVEVKVDEMGPGGEIIRDGVRYSVQGNDYGDGEPVDVSLHIGKAPVAR